MGRRSFNAKSKQISANHSGISGAFVWVNQVAKGEVVGRDGFSEGIFILSWEITVHSLMLPLVHILLFMRYTAPYTVINCDNLPHDVVFWVC